MISTRLAQYRSIREIYRFFRAWRWWAVRYRAWRIGAKLEVGYGSYILSPTVQIRLAPGASLIIGHDVCLRRYTSIEVHERVEIGNHTLIAEMVTIRDHNHNIVPGQIYRLAGFNSKPIWIGQNVWLGNKVTIISGVSIGDNTIVGANAVVTKDLPANVVAVGVPARIMSEVK